MMATHDGGEVAIVETEENLNEPPQTVASENSMNPQLAETASFRERVQRVLREPTKLLERCELQLTQPEQPLRRNPDIAPQAPRDHLRRSEEIRLRSLTARFSLPSEAQKTQTLPREEPGIPRGLIKELPNRSATPIKNQKRKKKRSKLAS